MTFPLNNEQLLTYLEKLELKPTVQKESEQVNVTLKIEGHEVPLFFGIRGDNDLMQTIAYLPFSIEEGKFAEMARMLHLINRDLDLPGFGMDEKANLIFYRCLIPCFDKQVNEQMLTMYIGATHLACKTFIGMIAMLLSGSLNVDDLKKNE